MDPAVVGRVLKEALSLVAGSQPAFCSFKRPEYRLVNSTVLELFSTC